MRSLAAALMMLATLSGAASAPASFASVVSTGASDEHIVLHQDESITLELDPAAPNGARVIARSAAPAPDEMDQASIRANLSAAASGWTGQNYGTISAPDRQSSPAPAPDIVTVTFLRIAGGDHVMLLLRNGYAQALNYRAYIYRAGNGEATDVCQVMPSKRGYEHWPYLIDSIELSGFSLSDWQDGQQLICR